MAERAAAGPVALDLLGDWERAGGRGRRTAITPPYRLRDAAGRARYLQDLTGLVAGWTEPVQVWHGPPAQADLRPAVGAGEAGELVRSLAASSRPRLTVLIPARPSASHADGSPPGDSESRDHLCIAGGVAAVWAVTDWPAAITPNWTAPLVEQCVHAVLHVRPLGAPAAQRLLRRRQSALASTRLLDERSGRLDDPQLALAVVAADELRAGLARGSTRLLHAQLLLVLTADDLPALRAAGDALTDTARGLLAQVQPLRLQHRPAWEATHPGGQPLRWPWRLVDAATVAATVPLPIGPPVPRRGRRERQQQTHPVLLGTEPASGVPLLADRWSAHNPTRLVVGTSGAGKSYAAKLELLRQRAAGVRAVVVDPEGEFGELTTAADGLHLEVGEEPVGLDPVGLATRPAIPAAEGLAVLTSWAAALLAQPLSAIDVALLDRSLAVLRADRGRTGATAGDLLSVITELSAYPPFVGADLPARLSPAAEGTVATLFAPNPALADPPDLVCFDLRAVAARIRPAVMATVLAWTWAQTVSTATPNPTLLVIDEAHLLLDDPAAADLLAQFARRSRKYQVGLDVVTQRLSDFLVHPAGQAVLANAATKLLLGCEDHERAAVVSGLGLTPAEASWLMPGTRGRGLFISADLHSPVRIVAGPHEHVLASTPPRR